MSSILLSQIAEPAQLSLMANELYELIQDVASHRHASNTSTLLEPHAPMVGYLHIMTAVFSSDGFIVEFSDRTIAKSLVHARYREFPEPGVDFDKLISNLRLTELGTKDETSTGKLVFHLDEKNEPYFYGQHVASQYSIFTEDKLWTSSIRVNKRYTQLAKFNISTNNDAGLISPPINAIVPLVR